MKLLVPILFSLFQSSSLQCLQCEDGLLDFNDCTKPSNQKQVNCWVNKGCMVAYDLFGTPVKMGCNNDNLYPINKFGWSQCLNYGLGGLFASVCTCGGGNCNKANLSQIVQSLPTIQCLSCSSASACSQPNVPTITCPIKDGCGAMYSANLANISNRTTIYQGCGGGLPNPKITDLLSYLYPACFSSVNPDGTYVTQCSCNDANACNVYSRFFGNCDHGWTYYNVTSKCYQVSQLIVNSYNEANNFCIKYGATLVSIQDLDENNFIANNVVNPYNNNTTPGFYIGLRWASGTDHTWIWGNGDSSNFTRWLPGQPDGKTAPANITRMIGTAQGFGFWDDIADTPTYTKKAICQKPAYSY